MVGDEDAVHPVLHRELGILCGEDTLEHDLHFRDIAHAPHRLPSEIAGLATAGDAGQIDAVVVVAAQRPFRETGAVVTAGAFTRVLAHETEKSFLIPTADAIDSDRKHRAAGRLCTFDQRLSDLPLRRGIKLEPDRRSARLGNSLHWVVRRSGEDLQMIAGARRLCDRHLAVRMKKLIAAGRAYEDG